MNDKSTELGMNRTGRDMSPINSKRMEQGAKLYPPSSAGDSRGIDDLRSIYIREADPVGKVPLPGTMKGVASSGMQMLAGRSPEVLIDKLGERLAFERTGTRLYDLLLNQLETQNAEAQGVPMNRLRQFRQEEYQHFLMVKSVMESLGADPTAQTPAADVNGVAAHGLVQILSDPRSTVGQCLQAILIAELADRDGWDLLVKLTGEMGLTDISAQFAKALEEEAEHLFVIRQLYSDLVLSLAKVKAAA